MCHEMLQPARILRNLTDHHRHVASPSRLIVSHDWCHLAWAARLAIRPHSFAATWSLALFPLSKLWLSERDSFLLRSCLRVEACRKYERTPRQQATFPRHLLARPRTSRSGDMRGLLAVIFILSCAALAVAVRSPGPLLRLWAYISGFGSIA